MSCLQGYIIATFDELVAAFGEPGESDGYKAAFEFTVAPDVYVYDWKSTNLYDEDLPDPDHLREGVHEWHIGGNTKADCMLVTTALAQVRKKRGASDDLAKTKQ